VKLTLTVLLCLAVVALIAAPNRANADRRVFYRGESFCGSKYDDWRARKRHWAAFVANERIGKGQSCGWSAGASTKQQAISTAMSRCKRMSQKHPELGIPNSCFLYDIR
jgi:hypothetical protein